MAIDDIDATRIDDGIETPAAEDPVASPHGAWLARPSLGTVRMIFALTATVLSISGATYGFSPLFVTATARADGEVGIVVAGARDRRAVNDASIEFLTKDDALVTMVTSNDSGRARQALREGRYQVRVSHPRFLTETRTVEVTRGETTDVRIHLRAPRPATAPAPGADAPARTLPPPDTPAEQPPPQSA